MRIAFLGSGAFGLPTIKALQQHHHLVAIATQPDRPAGRNKRHTPTPIAQWAHEHAPDTPLFKPDNINEPAHREPLRAIPADAWVVVAFGQYLSTPLLADRFVFNLHASRLPRWRGAAPIHHAILAGDTATGNSIITIARTMDAGDILAASHRDITPTTTTGDLHDALASDGPPLVLSVLEQHARSAVTATPQDESLITLAPKLSRDDAIIDFDRPADQVRRHINALSPWPGVAATFRDTRLKLLRAAPEQPGADAAPHPPGAIIDPHAGAIACANGSSIRILELQPAGRTPQTWAQFANGARPTAGEQLHAAR
ncbi:MAG: methionyl-tRNA formyltransferase [Phycisphaerales bacterium]